MKPINLQALVLSVQARYALVVDWWRLQGVHQRVRLALGGLVLLLGVYAASGRLGFGGSNRLPADQRQYFDKLSELKKRRMAVFPPTRAGEAERDSLEKEFDKRFRRKVAVTKWRCLVMGHNRDGLACEMKSRESDCTNEGSACPFNMEYYHDVYTYPVTVTDFTLVGRSVKNKKFYFGDLVEFDGVILEQERFGRFGDSEHFVDVTRVDILIKESVSVEAWKR